MSQAETSPHTTGETTGNIVATPELQTAKTELFYNLTDEQRAPLIAALEALPQDEDVSPIDRFIHLEDAVIKSAAATDAPRDVLVAWLWHTIPDTEKEYIIDQKLKQKGLPSTPENAHRAEAGLISKVSEKIIKAKEGIAIDEEDWAIPPPTPSSAAPPRRDERPRNIGLPTQPQRSGTVRNFGQTAGTRPPRRVATPAPSTSGTASSVQAEAGSGVPVPPSILRAKELLKKATEAPGQSLDWAMAQPVHAKDYVKAIPGKAFKAGVRAYKQRKEGSSARADGPRVALPKLRIERERVDGMPNELFDTAEFNQQNRIPSGPRTYSDDRLPVAPPAQGMPPEPIWAPASPQINEQPAVAQSTPSAILGVNTATSPYDGSWFGEIIDGEQADYEEDASQTPEVTPVNPSTEPRSFPDNPQAAEETPEKRTLSKGTKVAIAVGAVAVMAGAAYLANKKLPDEVKQAAKAKAVSAVKKARSKARSTKAKLGK